MAVRFRGKKKSDGNRANELDRGESLLTVPELVYTRQRVNWSKCFEAVLGLYRAELLVSVIGEKVGFVGIYGGVETPWSWKREILLWTPEVELGGWEIESL